MATKRRRNPRKKSARRSKSGYARPRVKVSKGTFQLGKRSPYKGKVTRVNPSRKRRNPSRGARKIGFKGFLGWILPLGGGLLGGWATTTFLLNRIGMFTSGWGLKLRGLVHIAIGGLGYGYSKNQYVQRLFMGFGTAGLADGILQNVPGASSLLAGDYRYRMVGADMPARSIRQTVGADIQAKTIRQNVSGGTDVVLG